ncbi:uncharacterized protein C3orf85 homolog [Hyperolius riggenbachi]|uniref:uncharacterized protein C3orf85 homolog n=1 Tax=Hyperolius riggenbachi TaxID=752182 RepID=UPI0035A26924
MGRAIIMFLQLLILIQGILGAAFFTEEATNQFLKLKRQAFSKHFWEPNPIESSWSSQIAEMASDTWKSMMDAAHYYLNMESADLSNYPTTREKMKAYIGAFWPSENKYEKTCKH